MGFIFRDVFTVARSGQDFSPSSFEILDVYIKSSTKFFFSSWFIDLLRANGDPSFSVLMSEDRVLLESVASTSQEVVITGDFNIHRRSSV